MNGPGINLRLFIYYEFFAYYCIMEQGVIILSLKKAAYSMGAFNLALSIRHYNPSIHITLVTDNEHQRHFHPEHYTVFDSIKTISPSHFIDRGLFQPALAKLNISKYSSYKRALYLDADSIVLQDIQPLFDKLNGHEFKGNVINGYTQWTDEQTFRQFFGFACGVTINSSWFYFEDGCRVFEQALKFYSKGFDQEKIEPKWGVSLPDELFFNAALIKTKINPKVDYEPMFFGNVIDQRSLSEIQDQFFSLTLYGGQKTVRRVYIDFYDRLCFKFCTERGIEHRFKADEIIKHKHVLNK